VASLLRFLLQGIAYAGLMALLGYFATMPPYRYADPHMASVKLSLNHATQRVKPCVKLTPEEIARFAANMRRSEACERARLPLLLQLDIDGRRVADIAASPSGLWNDGPASVYERFAVPAGEHTVSIRLRDSARTSGWDYAETTNVVLRPGRYFTITFRPEAGDFDFR
jgi:hypothetical protein